MRRILMTSGQCCSCFLSLGTGDHLCPLFSLPTKPGLASLPFSRLPSAGRPRSPFQGSPRGSAGGLCPFAGAAPADSPQLRRSQPSQATCVLPNESSPPSVCSGHLPLKTLGLKFSLTNQQAPSLSFRVPSARPQKPARTRRYTLSQTSLSVRFAPQGRRLHTSLKTSTPRASACWVFV